MIISVRIDCWADSGLELSLIMIYSHLSTENQDTTYSQKQTVVKSTLFSFTWLGVLPALNTSSILFLNSLNSYLACITSKRLLATQTLHQYIRESMFKSKIQKSLMK